MLPVTPEAVLVSKASPSGEMSALLVAIAATRDKQMFAQLFEYYAPRVKAYLMRQGTDGATAEELAQEAMLIVWRRADSFDPAKASAATWIYTIVRNLRIDALRKLRRPEFDVDDPAFVSDPPPRPDDVLQYDQLEQQVREALRQLPEEQAVVVRLSFFEDKPHGEIAAQLCLPLGTVKSRYSLAGSAGLFGRHALGVAAEGVERLLLNALQLERAPDGSEMQKLGTAVAALIAASRT